MSVQVDAERLVAELLRVVLTDVTVNIEHSPKAMTDPRFLQARVLPGGIVRKHAQTSHYDFELIGWSTVDRHTAQQVCARAHEALRRAWLRQTTTPNAPGALANYEGGIAPFQQRIPGMQDPAYRYSSTASIGVRTPGNG
jgi:hypothetical protein